MKFFYKLGLSVSVLLALAPYLHPVAEHKDFVTLTPMDQQKLVIITLYGTCIIDRAQEPIFFDLLESPALERLKKINQLGIYDKYSHHANFNRFDHSIGVWFLIRKAGGTLQEQVAGLLHDVSHTAFSHVGAYCFVTDYKQMDAYQDDEHEQYLYDSGIVDILKKHGLTIRPLPKLIN